MNGIKLAATAGAAALVATELCPPVRDYLIAAHTSVERGHRIILEHLELVPLLNLDLRLGEGTGAALAMHLVDDAVALLDEMTTFAAAGLTALIIFSAGVTHLAATPSMYGSRFDFKIETRNTD